MMMAFFDYYDEFVEGVSMVPLQGLYWIALVSSWLFIGLIIFIGIIQNPFQRVRTMNILVVSVIVLELIRQIWAVLSGSYNVIDHAPFHLCGLMVFFIPYAWFRRNEFMMNFTYYCAGFGGLMALLFNFNIYPLFHFITIQSFTIHAIIFVIPLFQILFLGFRPSLRYFRSAIILFLAVAALLYGLNLMWGSNYLFLMQSSPNSPLEFLESKLGYPGSLLVAFAGMVFVWYLMLVGFVIQERKKGLYEVSRNYLDNKAKRVE